jgi:hypothetical protein
MMIMMMTLLKFVVECYLSEKKVKGFSYLIRSREVKAAKSTKWSKSKNGWEKMQLMLMQQYFA